MSFYHFTTTCHLPRIIRSGELRPAIYRDGPPDFVHVTDNPEGEPTATGSWGDWMQDYRKGAIRRVRFTVSPEDFEPWRRVVARYPEWTANMIANLERVARERGSSAGWHCRPDPLPLPRVLAVHTRSYLAHRWEPFDLISATVLEATTDTPRDGVDCIGLQLGDLIYWSERERQLEGHDVYRATAKRAKQEAA